MEKILVSITVERALIDVGGTEMHESVQNLLYSEYKYHFSDCLEHPQSLKKILQKRYDGKYPIIVNKIRAFLGEISEREPFLEFMKQIGQG